MFLFFFCERLSFYVNANSRGHIVLLIGVCFFFVGSEQVREIDHLAGGWWQCLSDITLTMCNILISRCLFYNKYSDLNICNIF